jgi:hypothetical protein
MKLFSAVKGSYIPTPASCAVWTDARPINRARLEALCGRMWT